MFTTNKIKKLMYFNVGGAIVLIVSMLYGMYRLNNDYEFGIPMTEYNAWQSTLQSKKDSSDAVKTVAKTEVKTEVKAEVKTDSIKVTPIIPEVVQPSQPLPPKPGEPIPSSKPPIIKPKPASAKDTSQVVKPVETPKPVVEVNRNPIPSITWTSGKKKPVQFFHLILFTLLSGALGGILCNLRGIFKYNMSDQETLTNLIGSYYMRPFMSAITGMFTYFVANLIVTSVSVQPPIANGVPFAAFIGSLGFAMIAGFGSYEFMDRLKETARTLFGGTAPKTETETQNELINQLKNFNELRKDNVISEADFNDIKEKILKKLKAPQVNNALLQTMKNKD